MVGILDTQCPDVRGKGEWVKKISKENESWKIGSAREYVEQGKK
jgi:hypothetical protein